MASLVPHSLFGHKLTKQTCLLQDSVLSDSDAEDEGSGDVAQQQLASPAARAALTAYSIAVAPNTQKLHRGGGSTRRQEAATFSDQSCDEATQCSNQQPAQRLLQSPGQQKGGSRRRSKPSDIGESETEVQPLQVQGKSGSSLTRDPAKDIARAAARGRPNGVTLTNGLSLVPLIRPNTGGTGFRVTSFHPPAALAGPAQFSALEPVEFAIDRPPWSRISSSQSQAAASAGFKQSRRQDSVDDQMLRSQGTTADAGENDLAGDLPNDLADGFGAPSVITPILTTAQLDADSMEAARAITDYPWHYNFIPAARRAPSGTAGFAASSSIEQDRRRSLLQDAQNRKQGVLSSAMPKEASQDVPLLSLPLSVHANSSARMMMGYSRSLSGITQQRGLPSLEINGHPVSLLADRPSSAARVTTG